MYEETVDIVISEIDNRKSDLSNAGTRPLVSEIKQKAENIKDFIEGNSPDIAGFIVLAIPSGNDLLIQHFKGWKAEDFERLTTELKNLKI
jgi:hypothetical protein